MDWLAVFVIVAIVGQLCLPLVGAYRNGRARSMAKRRADLLEAAADRQLVKFLRDENKLDGKGVPHD